MKLLKNLLFIAFLFITIACSEPPVVEDPPPAKRLPSPAADDKQRKTFNDELILLLEQENFAELERIAQEITTKKERFPGGDWKLSRFYEAVGSPPSGPQEVRIDYKNRIEKIRKWIAQNPNSIYANIALGAAQIGSAWQIRGTGSGSTVGDQQLDSYHKQLKDADATLNKMKDRARECIAWYFSKQTIGIGLGWDRNEMLNLFRAAVRTEPLYYEIYSRFAYYLLPRWYGKPGEWERFTTDASRILGGVEGSILYSEVCWRMSRYYSGPEFFQQNKVNWFAIKKGFMDRFDKYGSSIRYLNAFCLMAGDVGDKSTSRVLFNQIGDRWEPDFWVEKKYFDGYKKWAFETK